MKTTTLIHRLAWALIAIGTFALGRVTAPRGAPAVEGGASGPGRRGGGSTLASRGAPASADDIGGARVGSGRLARAETRAGNGDIRSRLRDILSEPNLVKRSLAFAELLQNLTPENAKELFQIVREGPLRRESFRDMELLGYAWGALDGPGAMAELMGSERGPMFGGPAAMAAISGWASVDPNAALAWVNQQADTRLKGMYTEGVIAALARVDPDKATALVLSLPADEDKSRYVRTIAAEKWRGGLESATAWATTLPEGDLRSSAMRSIAFEYSRTDPQGALKWAVQNAGAQYAGDAVGMAMGMWARQDPEAASTYLNQLPVNPVRDAAVSSFAGMAVRDDPEGAIAWANTIADAATRTQTLADVARRWYRQDPEATTTWLANSGLSSEVQRSILQSPQPGSERGFRGRARGGFGPPPPDGGFGSRMGPP